ncbi:hypothetical protein D9758_005691 [Tetrapyrgos nigripes]|uniref:Uncharacterized protein n=1 Tax=Tetrapyrgos nigripes TaxID=182062 RepID=A0A8H5GK95_9AGAR|nr:hypothetical protein D9758_005691 [Tetrapyrgos nigripes]
MFLKTRLVSLTTCAAALLLLNQVSASDSEFDPSRYYKIQTAGYTLFRHGNITASKSAPQEFLEFTIRDSGSGYPDVYTIGYNSIRAAAPCSEGVVVSGFAYEPYAYTNKTTVKRISEGKYTIEQGYDGLIRCDDHDLYWSIEKGVSQDQLQGIPITLQRLDYSGDRFYQTFDITFAD